MCLGLDLGSLNSSNFGNNSLSGLLFTTLLHTLVANQDALGKGYPTDKWNFLEDGSQFDFIVVGAGSTGSVVANRLSENPEWNVLLLEAGGSPTATSEIPAAWPYNLKTEMDWNYKMEKMENCCLVMNKGECMAPRGKALGGTSSINAMLYVRGNAEDYNEWKNLGNDGWGYDDVLKYFKKSENLTGFELIDEDEYQLTVSKNQKVEGEDGDGKSNRMEISRMVSEKYHSSMGPLHVQRFGRRPLMDDIKNSIFEGVKELGEFYVPDVNGKNQIGFTESQTTTIKGRRASTAKTFLNPIKNRPNLFIVPNAVVHNLMLDGTTVVGVNVTSRGEIKTIIAVKEVILSAGSFNTPKILMLSGIGPKEHLQSHGIHVKYDLPGVGQNYQDHVVSYCAPISLKVPVSDVFPFDPEKRSNDYYEFLMHGNGPLSASVDIDIIGFADTLRNGTVPDIQYHFLFVNRHDTEGAYQLTNAFNFVPEVADQFERITRDADLLLVSPTLLRPKSTGKVELRSSNPEDPPKIIGNYLNNPEDLETLLRGIQFIVKLSETNALKGRKSTLEQIHVKNCSAHPFKTPEYWKCMIKHVSSNLYHPTSTCKMGPKTDSTAVVDNRLKVHGIQNLRVADASVMPSIVRGNTNAACIMIGEKASQIIKDDWGFSNSITTNE